VLVPSSAQRCPPRIRRIQILRGAVARLSAKPLCDVASMARGMPEVSVVIPTMNEEASIGAVIDEVHTALVDWDLEVLIVDTDSRDRTRDIAMEKGARVVPQPRRGYGRAYKTGFAAATGTFIATLDAAPLAAPPRRHGVLRGTQARGDPRRIPVPRDPGRISNSSRGQEDPQRQRRDGESDLARAETGRLGPARGLITPRGSPRASATPAQSAAGRSCRPRIGSRPCGFPDRGPRP